MTELNKLREGDVVSIRGIVTSCGLIQVHTVSFSTDEVMVDRVISRSHRIGDYVYMNDCRYTVLGMYMPDPKNPELVYLWLDGDGSSHPVTIHESRVSRTKSED